MFTPSKGLCKKCLNERLIVVKAGLCQKCNEQLKRLKKFNKESCNQFLNSDTDKQQSFVELKKRFAPKKRKITGELELFQEIWNTRAHICEVTGELIRRFDIRSFSHILSKGSEPAARLDPDNIKLVLPEIHEIWETGNTSHPMFDWVHERKILLKRKYSENARKTTVQSLRDASAISEGLPSDNTFGTC